MAVAVPLSLSALLPLLLTTTAAAIATSSVSWIEKVEGETVVLGCTWEGDPTDTEVLDVEWFLRTPTTTIYVATFAGGTEHVYAELASRARFARNVATQRDASLQIAGLRASDLGVYTCKVKFGSFIKQESTNLTVLAPPPPPPPPPLSTRRIAMGPLLGLCALPQLCGAVAGTSWWSLALWTPSSDPENQLSCMEAPGLSPRQRKICQKYPKHMAHVAEGARLALAECQHQFRAKRWNCTASGAEDALGPLAPEGSREAAFVSAITAAGVVHAVARACRQGALQGSCSWVVPNTMRLPLYGQRGGSADDVEYGYQFARRFVDARKRIRGGRESLAKVRQMNLHNNEAGRLAVYNLAHMACRCQGLLGTCTLKTCSQQLADFRKVGDFLKEKYKRSSAVRLASRGTNGRPGGGGGGGGEAGSLAARWSRRRLEPVNEWLAAPTPSDLVHVNASPDYCEGGTAGPRCDFTSEGTEKCSMCCDRGYDTSQVTVEEQCGCKEQLRWNVKCQLCPWTIDQFFCK